MEQAQEHFYVVCLTEIYLGKRNSRGALCFYDVDSMIIYIKS